MDPTGMKAKVIVLLGCGLLLWGGRARADGPSKSSERAEELYVQGKQLAQEQRYAEACSKFEESQRLEPAIGTQFNLADCLEHTSKPASALALFVEVARVARLSGKQDRLRAAEERISSLERAVPRLVIHLVAPPAAATILRDGETVAPASLGQRVPVDPGEHSVSASAPGFQPFARTVTVQQASASVVEVTIALTPVPSAPTPSAAPPPVIEQRSTLAYAGAGVAALGVISLGVGTVFGIDAVRKKSDAGCDQTDCRAPRGGGGETLRDAQASGDVATIFFVIGGALVAGGAALFLLTPKVRVSAARASAALVYGASW